MQSPYFNMILTLSMHGNYESDLLTKWNIKSPFKYPANFSKQLRHYLDICYFTDIQIGKYINHLKEADQYKNSMIIICADHEVKKTDCEKIDIISKDLPLILVNTHIATRKFYHGQINQIDLFPTMLDMFGIKSKWRGLGHSLLRLNYDSTISNEERHISDMILCGDYFSKQNRN